MAAALSTIKFLPLVHSFVIFKKTIQNIIRWQTGGAQQHVNKSNINNSHILIPKQEILERYSKALKSLFDRITINCFENSNLTEIRDILLPKLMSGQIRVPVGVKK